MEVRTILLVDDEEDLRTVGELSLQSVGGWRVLLAGSGEEALHIAARCRPDLILLDVMMPGMDGPTTLARLRDQDATVGIPVVFLTAKGREPNGSSYREMGAVGVLAKPFDPMTLPDEVRRIASPL